MTTTKPKPPDEFYCLQVYVVMPTGGEWVYCWSWDLGTLFTTFEQAETERVEFHSEDRTRIVRVRVVEAEVAAVFDAEEFEPAVPAGRLF